jgi:hypothetical protein
MPNSIKVDPNDSIFSNIKENTLRLEDLAKEKTKNLGNKIPTLKSV